MNVTIAIHMPWQLSRSRPRRALQVVWESSTIIIAGNCPTSKHAWPFSIFSLVEKGASSRISPKDVWQRVAQREDSYERRLYTVPSWKAYPFVCGDAEHDSESWEVSTKTKMNEQDKQKWGRRRKGWKNGRNEIEVMRERSIKEKNCSPKKGSCIVVVFHTDYNKVFTLLYRVAYVLHIPLRRWNDQVWYDATQLCLQLFQDNTELILLNLSRTKR